MNPQDPNLDANGDRIVGKMPDSMPENPRTRGKTKKPKLSDLLKEQDIKDMVIHALMMANNGDTTMLKFMLEQHFGKAPQSMDITSDGEPIPLLDGLYNNERSQEIGKAEETN